jgi:hypothetical protein
MVLGALACGCGGDDTNASDDDSSSTDASADDDMTMTGADDDDDDDDDTATSEGSMTSPDSSSTDPDPDTSSGTDTSGTDSSGTTMAPTSTDSSGTDDTSSSDDASSESTTDPTALPDITGDHLLAVSISLAPDTPLQYIATVVQSPDGDGALLDVSLQPLTLDVGSTTSPRLPFGPAIDIDDVEVAADGTFEIVIPVLDVAAETNPITGSDATAMDVVLTGQIVDEASWCGTMDGDLTMPIESPLTGSTFAGTAFEDDLPLVFPWEC